MMWTLATPALEIVIRAALIYLAFLAGLGPIRQTRGRPVHLLDLALVLLAANALQPAMTGPDQSVAGALIILVTIFVLNRVIAQLRVRSALLRRLLESEPSLIGRDGRWLLPRLVRQDLDLLDVEAALREHGLDSVAQMKRATLEVDGSISIVAADGADTAQARRPRRRYRPRK
jgi:uncharacterized membrane protein YcaP (DUF421 family)